MRKIYELFSQGTGYGWAALSPKLLAAKIKESGINIIKLREELKFDAVAFCGSSGAALAFHLAAEYELPIIYVRKEKEECHGYRVECNLRHGHIKKYLIVDDFVDTGSTIKYIIGRIDEFALERNAHALRPVGIYCYDPCMEADKTFQPRIKAHRIKIHTNHKE